MDEVIVGSYEGFLLGYSMSNDFESNKLKQTFATHSHTSSVRCLDISGRFLASGGTDDKVVVIDLKTRKEHTVLMHHDGTVNALAFTSRGTHLVTGSSDGSIVVIRVGNFQIEKKWKKAHGGSPVNAIAVHPSDKLALSIGGDKSLRTWNLVKGRPAFTINLSSKGVNLPTDLAWSPGGDRFSLISQQTVDIWTISKAGIEKRITCNSKPTSVAWISDEKLAVGLENGNILTMTVTDTQALTCHAHKQRVKCLFYTSGSLYSASSSGEIKLWCLSDNNCLTERCIANSGCRVTCISVNHQSKFIKKEEASDEEKDQEESKEDEVNEHEEREVEEVDVKPSEVENKNRSYVSIQYEDEEQDEPASKKLKKKKKLKNNFKKKRD